MQEMNEPDFVIPNDKAIKRKRGGRGPSAFPKVQPVPIGDIVRAIHKQSPQWMDPKTVQWFGTKLPSQGYRGAGDLAFFATGERLERGRPVTSFGIVRCVDLITGQMITVEEVEWALAIANAIMALVPTNGRTSRARAMAEARAKAYARASHLLAGVRLSGGVDLDALTKAREVHRRMGMGTDE